MMTPAKSRLFRKGTMKKNIFDEMALIGGNLEGFIRHISEKRTAAFFQAGTWSPNVDIFETADCIFILFELAGVRKEDVEVELHNSMLVVRGFRKLEKIEEEGIFHQMEIGHGDFERIIALPSGVASSMVSAKMNEGILKVEIKKEKPRKNGSERIVVKFK